jgi:hypothetical protein
MSKGGLDVFLQGVMKKGMSDHDLTRITVISFPYSLLMSMIYVRDSALGATHSFLNYKFIDYRGDVAADRKRA